mgnify:CR=1 FL=1
MVEYVLGMRVTHVMADGTRRDSVDGLTVPTTGVTEMFYKILQRVEDNQQVA